MRRHRQFAVFEAYEMNMPSMLTDEHWRIIYYLRDAFKKTGEIPTAYETCKANEMESKRLEEFFPTVIIAERLRSPA